MRTRTKRIMIMRRSKRRRRKRTKTITMKRRRKKVTGKKTKMITIRRRRGQSFTFTTAGTREGGKDGNR